MMEALLNAHFFAFHRPTVLPSGSCIHANVPVGISTGGTSVFPPSAFALSIRHDVIYVDVEHRVVIWLMPQRRYVPADAAGLRRDHRRRSHRFDLPIEEFLVE